MTARRSRAGFTLIELLVVTSIIGLVMAVGTSTLYGVIAAWNERQAVAELDAKADLALESIRRDIADTLSFDVSGIAIEGATRSVQDSRTYPPAQHRDDQLAVPIRAMDPNRPLAVPAKVGYHVERAGGVGVLVRTVGTLSGGFPETNRIEVIPNARVMGFAVQYLAPGPGAVWVDEWNQPGQPAAVGVSLSIEDPDRPAQFQVSRQIVVPVHVR